MGAHIRGSLQYSEQRRLENAICGLKKPFKKLPFPLYRHNLQCTRQLFLERSFFGYYYDRTQDVQPTKNYAQLLIC